MASSPLLCYIDLLGSLAFFQFLYIANCHDHQTEKCEYTMIDFQLQKEKKKSNEINSNFGHYSSSIKHHRLKKLNPHIKMHNVTAIENFSLIFLLARCPGFPTLLKAPFNHCSSRLKQHILFQDSSVLCNKGICHNYLKMRFQT